jgi:hypothetical protein
VLEDTFRPGHVAEDMRNFILQKGYQRTFRVMFGPDQQALMQGAPNYVIPANIKVAYNGAADG